MENPLSAASTIAPELAAAVEQFGRPESAVFEAHARAERAHVLQSFPVSSWPTMTLDRYALGLGGEAVPYCQLMEYRTPNLGSINDEGGHGYKDIHEVMSQQTDLLKPIHRLRPLGVLKG